MMSKKPDALPLEESPPDAVNIPNKTKADFLKTISPSRKVQSTLEAKLILGVLDGCIYRMEIACLLPTMLNCPEALSPNLGEEVVKALKEHQRLEEKYSTTVADGSLDRSEWKEQLATSPKSIQDSFRNIVRLLKTIPTAGEVLKGIEAKTGEGMGSQKLRDGLCELRNVVLERLLTTPAEERESGEMILEVSLRLSANQKLIDSLDKEVSMAIKDKDTEISRLNNKVQQLKSSLYQMEKGLKKFVVRTQEDAEKQGQSDKKTSEGKRARMQQEASQLRAQLNNVITANRDRELELRKKKYKEETEIENLIQRYDAEMGEKQTELEEMTRMHEKDETEMRELEELFAVLDLEYSQIMEERQQAQELKEQLEKEREMQSQAATVIQAHWRGFCVRKAMKANAKPKKGKKSKGKKGK